MLLKKLLLAFGLFFNTCIAAAAPDFSRKSDTAPLYMPGSRYHFDILNYQSADGKRRYRIYLGIPKTAVPKQGHSVLYALDGNALTENLTPQRLNTLKRPPVLVLVGYDTDLRFDTAARAHDYTPPNHHGQIFSDAVDPTRTHGGAADFLQLINTAIRPQIEARVKLNPERQILWGHSYGGLFVLYTLLNSPQSFTHYIAADPALWFEQGSLYRQYQAAFRRPDVFLNRTLSIEQSQRKRGRNTRKPTPEQAARLAARQQAAAQLPSGAGKKLTGQMSARNDIRAEFTGYPELDHGGILPVSFLHALEIAAEP
ncbi:alpha/beta hydrolase [Neisseria yangbaofengii]|uniref:alpha/beta hydrolase n=1 Tax=Neisseria yangbaofengii TaxID=2709396 RepID=UPI0013EC0808|nr:alpha/beta fold hydrolase [Neisseria yangbaofengii]